MLHPITGQRLVSIEVKISEQERIQNSLDNRLEEIESGFDTPDMQEDSD